MNIQQLRYVVAIANSGTFREAAETTSTSDKELAAQILARAETAAKASYRLAAHPVDDIITEDLG